MTRLDEIRKRSAEWGSYYELGAPTGDAIDDRQWLLEQVDRLREAVRVALPVWENDIISIDGEWGYPSPPEYVALADALVALAADELLTRPQRWRRRTETWRGHD